MNSSEERDKRLVRAGVAFLPWIGEFYCRGLDARRLLILGESHYNFFDGGRNELWPEITRDSVKELIDDKRQQVARLWINLEKAFIGGEGCNHTDPRCRAHLWQSVAFYNYVQTPVEGGARKAPRAAQFRNSECAFLEVLEILRPERVVVCGMRLWNNMVTPFERETPKPRHLYLSKDVQAFRLADNTPVWCIAIHHPSSGFSPPRWRRVIVPFLKGPQQVQWT